MMFYSFGRAQNLNSTNCQNIRLTHTISRTFVEFLDIKILADGFGRITTDVHHKETAVNSLLHASSFHPRHTIRSIPVGQFVRIRCICDTEKNFEEQAARLKSRFQKREYRRTDIKRAYNRAKMTHWTTLLTLNMRRTSDHKVCLIRGVCKHFWPILLTDPDLKECVSPQPQLVARRCKTLGDYLVQSHYVPQKSQFIFGSSGVKWGFRPCGNCSICTHMERVENVFDWGGGTIWHTPVDWFT